MSLNHPNIIELYDFKLTQDFIFIIMEYMEGGELFTLIQ